MTLPSGWAYCEVSDVAADNHGAITDGPFGSKLKSDHYTTSGVRVIRLGNIGSRKFISNDEVFIAENRLQELRRHEACGGDLVTAALGEPLGRTAPVPYEYGPAIVKADCFRLRLSASVDKDLILYWLNSPTVLQSFLDRSQGIGRVRINLGTFRTTRLPLPPVAEQRRIVMKLDALTARIARARAELKEARRSVIRLKARTVSSIFGEIQSSRTPLSELLIDIRYGTAKKCDYKDGATPVLRIPNVQSGTIELRDVKFANFEDKELRNLALKLGDILVIRSNGSISLVGRSAVVSESEQGMLYAGYLIRLRLHQKKCLPGYLQFFLHSDSTRSVLENAARSTSGVHNINTEHLRNLIVPIPDIHTQAQAVMKLQAASARADRLEAEIARATKLLDRLEASILTKTFRGELVPQDPSDEPASALLDRIRAERAAAPMVRRGRARGGTVTTTGDKAEHGEVC